MLKMQKSKSHSFVIFPSSVRTIPFTVPRLPTSSSCPPASSSSIHDTSLLASSDPKLISYSRTTKLHSSDAFRPPWSPLPEGPFPTDDEGHLPTATATARGQEGAGPPGERWASVPCFSPFLRLHQSEEKPPHPSTNLRKAEFKNSSETVSRKDTIDLEHAHQLFGIDPSLYLSTGSGLDEGSLGGWPDTDDDEEEGTQCSDGTYDESNIGRVWFAIEYDPETERLLFSLLRIRNLPHSFVSNQNSRDPIVRIWLMPDERRWVQAKFKRRSCNPRFNEDFAFQVSYRDFASRSIKLTVFGSGDKHSGNSSRRQQPFCHVVYPLKDHVSDPNERIVIWRDLEKELTASQLTNGGGGGGGGGDAQLFLSLSYDGHSNQLTIALHSGKNFPPSDDQQSNEFYIVVSQMEMSKVVKRKKSSIVKQIINFSPIFNELFHFKVRSSGLDTTSLLITVMRHNTGRKDGQIGRLVLGSFMFARGQELDHWNAMLTNEKQSIARWHTLTN